MVLILTKGAEDLVDYVHLLAIFFLTINYNFLIKRDFRISILNINYEI